MLWIGISQISLLLSNFILLKLLSDQLSVYEYGQYALLMSVALFVRQILYDPFSMVVAKKSAVQPAKISESLYVAKIITDRIAVGLLISGFVIAIFMSITGSYNSISALLVCSLIYVCANGAQGFYINIFNSVKERKPASIVSILDSISKILIVCLIFNLFDINLVNTIASIALAAILTIFAFRLYIAKRIYIPEKSLKKMNGIIMLSVAMSYPFILPTILLALKTIGDRWVLASFLGVTDLAGYSILLQIGYSPMVLFFGMLQTYIAPLIYSYGSSPNPRKMRDLRVFLNKILFLIILGSLLVAAALSLVSNWLVELLVGRNYEAVAHYLPYFVIAGALSAAGGVLQVAAMGVFKSKDAGTLLVITLIISATCTTLLLLGFGFAGAVAGLVASAFIIFIIYWIKLNHALNLKIQGMSL